MHYACCETEHNTHHTVVDVVVVAAVATSMQSISHRGVVASGDVHTIQQVGEDSVQQAHEP